VREDDEVHSGAANFCQMLLHLKKLLRIQLIQRLIQQQHLRAMHQRPCQQHPTALAVGEAKEVFPRQFAQVKLLRLLVHPPPLRACDGVQQPDAGRPAQVAAGGYIVLVPAVPGNAPGARPLTARNPIHSRLEWLEFSGTTGYLPLTSTHSRSPGTLRT
jgi:hypothetical protein